jgi:hypothetical protein
MSELVDKDAFLKQERKWYCENCDRRKGVKNGRKCFVYEIGEVPCRACDVDDVLDDLEYFPTASSWHRVEEELPKEPGEYIVAYHPCYWDDVKTKVTKVGIDTFRGKSAWAKKKFQRVTHWMEKPKPPKEDA